MYGFSPCAALVVTTAGAYALPGAVGYSMAAQRMWYPCATARQEQVQTGSRYNVHSTLTTLIAVRTHLHNRADDLRCCSGTVPLDPLAPSSWILEVERNAMRLL